MKPFYLTTPLYYVNAKPHIGHAYTNILCDTFARWRRFRGQKVHFLTGTDEHGTKIEKAARAEGKEPRQYVDGMVPQFESLWELLGIRYDDFIRTTEERHKQEVANVLRDLEARGEIYKAGYKGSYCTPCESFWTPLQLAEGKCPDCGREVQELAEENYFFRLSKYRDWLVSFIKDHPGFIRPEIRANEILGFLREPLEDLCITRPRARLAWGIDYPSSREHVVYVWFDALINYVSAVGCTTEEKKFKTYWPADIHVVGKDILRQHAVYWPIMLKALGLEMPRTILAHGWWTMAGAKVSKSRGNAVDPVELCKKYGVDAFRYFLLNEVTVGQDGAFSEDLLAERYTTDLANGLGNLWFRFASMLEKYFQKRIPQLAPEDLKEIKEAESTFYDLWQMVKQKMDQWDPRGALNIIWDVVTWCDGVIEDNKPWVLAKDPTKEKDLRKIMFILGENLAHVACLLQPFLPKTAEQILSRLGLKPPIRVENDGDFSKLFLLPDTLVERGGALFPRLDEAK